MFEKHRDALVAIQKQIEAERPFLPKEYEMELLDTFRKLEVD